MELWAGFSKGESFSNMLGVDGARIIEVGNGLSDFDGFEMATGGEFKFVGSGLKEFLGGWGEVEVLLDFRWR